VASNAEIAYDWAFQYAIICGFGYFRYETKYAHTEPRNADEMRDLEISIERILNPFAVYFDPSCQHPTYGDAKWAFVIEDVIPEDYKRRFPGASFASLSDFGSIGDSERDWFQDGMIRIAEYWTVEREKRTLVGLTDGTVAWEDQLPEGAQIAARDGEPLTRELEIPRVRSAIINAREILGGSKTTPPFGSPWLGPRIPIIPVLGEELVVDGKRILSGIVRHAKGAQEQYNFMRSAMVESVALAPKAPFIAAVGQLEGHEAYWDQANRRNFAYLPYNVLEVGGHAVGPPQRNFGEAPISAIATAIAQADQDLKSTTRIHEPMIGISSGEQSGRAIGLRQNQGNLANFAYTDNLARSIMRLGEDLVAIMPKVYDRPGRVVRIVKPDQTHKLVTLNQPYAENKNQPDVTTFYDMQAGTYDITISVGPGYESKRQEFVASVLQLVQTAPQIAQFIMDLLVRNMDWPGANDIAERLKKMLPPQLQEDGNGAPEIPAAFAQKMEAALQEIAALTQALNQSQSTIDSKRIEIESRERMSALQEQTKLLVAELKAQSAEGIALLNQRMGAIDKRLGLLHADRTVEEEMAGQPQERIAA